MQRTADIGQQVQHLRGGLLKDAVEALHTSPGSPSPLGGSPLSLTSSSYPERAESMPVAAEACRSISEETFRPYAVCRACNSRLDLLSPASTPSSASSVSNIPSSSSPTSGTPTPTSTTRSDIPGDTLISDTTHILLPNGTGTLILPEGTIGTTISESRSGHTSSRSDSPSSLAPSHEVNRVPAVRIATGGVVISPAAEVAAVPEALDSGVPLLPRSGRKPHSLKFKPSFVNRSGSPRSAKPTSPSSALPPSPSLFSLALRIPAKSSPPLVSSKPATPASPATPMSGVSSLIARTFGKGKAKLGPVLEAQGVARASSSQDSVDTWEILDASSARPDPALDEELPLPTYASLASPSVLSIAASMRLGKKRSLLDRHRQAPSTPIHQAPSVTLHQAPLLEVEQTPVLPEVRYTGPERDTSPDAPNSVEPPEEIAITAVQREPVVVESPRSEPVLRNKRPTKSLAAITALRPRPQAVEEAVEERFSFPMPPPRYCSVAEPGVLSSPPRAPPGTPATTFASLSPPPSDASSEHSVSPPASLASPAASPELRERSWVHYDSDRDDESFTSALDVTDDDSSVYRVSAAAPASPSRTAAATARYAADPYTAWRSPITSVVSPDATSPSSSGGVHGHAPFRQPHATWPSPYTPAPQVYMYPCPSAPMAFPSAQQDNSFPSTPMVYTVYPFASPFPDPRFFMGPPAGGLLPPMFGTYASPAAPVSASALSNEKPNSPSTSRAGTAPAAPVTPATISPGERVAPRGPRHYTGRPLPPQPASPKMSVRSF